MGLVNPRPYTGSVESCSVGLGWNNTRLWVLCTGCRFYGGVQETEGSDQHSAGPYTDGSTQERAYP